MRVECLFVISLQFFLGMYFILLMYWKDKRIAELEAQLGAEVNTRIEEK